MDPKLKFWRLLVMLFNYEIEVVLVARTGFFSFSVFLPVFVAVVFSELSLLFVNDDAVVRTGPPPFLWCHHSDRPLGHLLRVGLSVGPGQTGSLFLWGPLCILLHQPGPHLQVFTL